MGKSYEVGHKRPPKGLTPPRPMKYLPFKVTDGRYKSPKQPNTWKEFEERVEAAWERYKKHWKRGQARKGQMPGPDTAIGKIEQLWGKPIPPERRCVAVTSKGQPCKSWAVRGATRCVHHGGMREAPESKATMRAYAAGTFHEEQAAIRANAKWYNEATAEERRVIGATVREVMGRRNMRFQVAGIDALRTDDGGRAWRRWIKQMEAHKQARDGMVEHD